MHSAKFFESHSFLSLLVAHPGLPLLAETDYPDEVLELHRDATTNVLK